MHNDPTPGSARGSGLKPEAAAEVARLRLRLSNRQFDESNQLDESTLKIGNGNRRSKLCRGFLLGLFLFFFIGAAARSVVGSVGLGIVCLTYEFLKRYSHPREIAAHRLSSLSLTD